MPNSAIHLIDLCWTYPSPRNQNNNYTALIARQWAGRLPPTLSSRAWIGPPTAFARPSNGKWIISRLWRAHSTFAFDLDTRANERASANEIDRDDIAERMLTTAITRELLSRVQLKRARAHLFCLLLRPIIIFRFNDIVFALARCRARG